MNRIDRTFASLQAKREKALTLFLTDGFPAIDSTPDLVLTLEKGGADMIELGMPFSDPLADGPVIQRSSAVALRNGVTLSTLLADARRIRTGSNLPIVLMGYLNPILAFGAERFFAASARAGVDGIILPEVPVEEAPRFHAIIRDHGLAHILLVTPMSSSRRIAAIDRASSGFLYCVSTTGVTGVSRGSPVGKYIRRVKAVASRNPVQVGFGISTPDDARFFARQADGIIMGSALITEIARGASRSKLRHWVETFKRGMR